MKTSKEKAIDLMLGGLALKFVPIIIIVGLGYLENYLSRIVLLTDFIESLYLGSFLIGYGFFIKGWCLYTESKGYSSKWSWLGIFSVFSLPLFLLISSKKNTVFLQALPNEGLVNEPFDQINIPELFWSLCALPFLLVLVLSIVWSLSNLNASEVVEIPAIKIIIIIILYVSFLLVLFREFQDSGLDFKRVIGYKNSVNLKLISLIVILEFAFARGFNSLFLYNLSFVFPSYVENYINEKEFTNIWEMIGWGFSAMIVAPLLEELLFRGIILQKWVIKWGVKAGILTSSLFFAVIHFRFDVISLLLASIILSILYFKTRNLITPILCHFFYNTLVTILNFINYFSQTTIERSAIISVEDYQVSIQALLGQRIFLLAISAPFLIYFVYKNFPRNNVIIPYYANETKSHETN